MNRDELRQRTKRFGLRVLKLIDALPGRAAGRIITNQLGRSGTAVGANYRAACKSRSRAEFISKIGVVEEEADESAYWLEMIIEAGLLRMARVESLLTEANELTAIMAASRITASKSLNKTGNRRSTIRNSIGNRQSAIGNC
jgi:four helix bundle protein